MIGNEYFSNDTNNPKYSTQIVKEDYGVVSMNILTLKGNSQRNNI